MSGVFLSYSRGDRAPAEQIIQGLRVLGVDVWWDEDMPGVDWQEELERQINELACVLVLWTPQSRGSKNVKDEARLGLRSEKLVNVLIGAPEPPFPFDRVNGLPLDGWTGREPHHGWTRVVQTVEPLIVKAGGAKPGEITGALARRDRALRLAQATIEEAEHAFQDAQIRETEAAETATAAGASLTRAEEQLQRMLEMRVSSAVMRTAQQELDDAQAAREAASQLQRTAKAALSEASRALTRAKTALDRLVSDTMAPAAQPDAPTPASEPVAETMAPDTKASEQPEPVAAAATARFSPELALAPEPKAAPATSPPPPSTPTRPWLPWLVVGCCVGIVALFVWVFVAASSGKWSVSYHPPAWASAAPGPTAAESAASAAPTAAPTPNPLINGKWTLQNVSCAGAIVIAIHGDTISVGSSSMKIASVDPDGTVNAGPDTGRYNYEVAGDTLTVTSPNADQTSYTRCAG